MSPACFRSAHNPDYVKFAPSVSYVCLSFGLPGESAAGERPPSGTSGLQARRGAAHLPSASLGRSWVASVAPAVVSSRYALETTASAAHFVSVFGGVRGREVPPRRTVVRCSRSCPHCVSGATRASCRLRQLRCWVASTPDVSRRPESASSHPPLPLLGTASPWFL
jgi:hypothetical protein